MGPALGQPKIPTHGAPRPVEIYVGEATLNLKTPKHPPGHFDSLVILYCATLGEKLRWRGARL